MDTLVGASAGMNARVGFAILSAIAGGAWLLAKRKSSSDGDRIPAILRTGLLLLCAFWSVAWLAIAMLRLNYPYELEWCSGAMRDMSARTLHGQPLYVAPGPDWFPYEYPPLYLWASAFLMRIMGGEPTFAPMRIISILSTLGSAAILYHWVRFLAPADESLKTGRVASNTWALAAAGIFLASYRFTGAWYDIERLDMLFLFFSLLGAFLLQLGATRESTGWCAASAVALVLAFMTKQQAILFMIGGAAALAWSRKWKLLGIYGVVCAVLSAGFVAGLSSATGGWFWYYCFKVPLANGIKTNLAFMFLLGDLPLFAPVIVIAALGAYLSRRNKIEESQQRPMLPVMTAMTVMGVFGSLLSRAHWGGDQNVLITGYVFLGVAACVLAGRLSREHPALRAPFLALAIAQLLTLTYRPAAQLPTASGREYAAKYASLVRSLEREGPVLSLEHGAFTSPARFHLMALLDVMNTEKGLPAPLMTALRSHYYSAIVMDAKPDAGGYLGEFLRNYPNIQNVEISNTWIATGYPTPSPSRTVWVLRP